MSTKTPDTEWDFSEDTDEQLVQCFNRDVGKTGWVARRGGDSTMLY
jgi:hypothetical protein